MVGSIDLNLFKPVSLQLGRFGANPKRSLRTFSEVTRLSSALDRRDEKHTVVVAALPIPAD
jgi:hypothetical protein